MAQEHDLFDDIIEISKGFDFLKNPLGGVTDALDPSAPQWNPADYKERPRGNTIPCLTCKNEKSGCSACMDVCPVNAIEVEEDSIEILDSCRKCGLCSAVCPTETLSTRRHMPRQVYDQIARVASAYEQCYVTCTRALKRIPKGNEVVLACVGDLSRDLWFSLLTDYDNISVYLPVGICDRCKTTTGEATYVDAIGTAEEWAKASVGLEVDQRQMTHELTRDYKRSQFVSSAIHSAERLVSRTTPALAGAQAVAKKISDHTKRIDEMQRQLEAAVNSL